MRVTGQSGKTREAVIEAHPHTRGYRLRLRIVHVAIAILATVGGAAVGFAVTLAIVVAKARAGSYIFGLEDMVAVRWELLPILVGSAAGFKLGRRRPHSVAWATVSGFGGWIAGTGLGALLGALTWGDGAGPWAGAVMGGALGLAGGSVASLRIRRVPRRPLIAGVALTLAFLGTIAFGLFGATNLFDLDPLDFPESAGVPIPDPANVDAVVFLLGDAGATVEGRSPLLNALQADVERWSAALHRDSAVSVAYLGDLVYPDGIRHRSHQGFPTDSARLWNQVDLVGGPAAKQHATIGLFVTGNHDWGNASGDEGLDRIANLAEQLDMARAAGHYVSLQPAAGDPGPTVRDLRRNVRIAFFDTHWFLQERSALRRTQFFERLREVLASAGDREVILVAHHPYVSMGPHGAFVPGYHVGGLAYVLRQAGALVQDLNSPAYEELLAALRQTFVASRKPPLIYAGGHDHSLQVLTGAGAFDPRFVLVSGAGSKVSSILMGPRLTWAGSQPGYMMLVFRKDDGVDLFVVGGDNQYLTCHGPDDTIDHCMTDGVNAFEIVHSVSLLGPSKAPPASAPDTGLRGTPWWTEQGHAVQPVRGVRPLDSVAAPPVGVSTRVLLLGTDSVTTTTGRSYAAGRVHRLLAGNLNRHLWSTPVRLPVLDLSAVAGGLRPVKMIGGKQTVGLRLRGADGLEYDFRPVVKGAALVLPPWLRGGVVESMLDDQMAAQFPFAGVVVGHLLAAAGVVAPQPVAVVMPNEEGLGEYRAMFAGRVGLFAVNANERAGNRPGFAGYTHIIDSDSAYVHATTDPGATFDAQTFLRARLIDFLVGDWDRHSNQWRWGRDDDAKGARWRPIPEDRDWAFARIDGLVAVAARLLQPKYVGFSSEFPAVSRLAQSGERVDHRVLNELDRNDFLAAARDVQAALPDSVIASAVATLPPPYVALEHHRLVDGLTARRQALVEYAEEYYRLLARTVRVFGVAQRRDIVEFTRISDQRVRIRVQADARGPVHFERLVDARDTREVELFIDAAEDQIVGRDDLPFHVRITEPEQAHP